MMTELYRRIDTLVDALRSIATVAKGSGQTDAAAQMEVIAKTAMEALDKHDQVQLDMLPDLPAVPPPTPPPPPMTLGQCQYITLPACEARELVRRMEELAAELARRERYRDN